jgi:uridine kinase
LHTESSAVCRIKTDTRLISVAGGSCTGKTTFISQLRSALGDRLSVIHLDDYQTGSEWDKRKTSVYGWDDPEHFSVPEMERTVSLFLNGKNVSVPQFSLKENRRTGARNIIHTKMLLIEGLYVLQPFLSVVPDMGIYLEAPFYVRFIRRIVRFMTEVKPEDAATPLRHMVMNTYRAHRAFVSKQKDFADLVAISSHTGETLHTLLSRCRRLRCPRNGSGYRFIQPAYRIQLYETAKADQYFVLRDKGRTAYAVKLEDEWRKELLAIDMESV